MAYLGGPIVGAPGQRNAVFLEESYVFCKWHVNEKVHKKDIDSMVALYKKLLQNL